MKENRKIKYSDVNKETQVIVNDMDLAQGFFTVKSNDRAMIKRVLKKIHGAENLLYSYTDPMGVTTMKIPSQHFNERNITIRFKDLNNPHSNLIRKVAGGKTQGE